MCVCVFSHVRLFVTPWTIAHQVPCPWNFPGKNIGMSCHFFLSPGGLPNQEIKPECPASAALAAGFLTTETPGKPC